MPRRLCAAQASMEASRRCATAARRTCCRRSTRRRCRRRWPTAMPALSRRRRTPAGSCSGRPSRVRGGRGSLVRFVTAMRFGPRRLVGALWGYPWRLAVRLVSTLRAPRCYSDYSQYPTRRRSPRDASAIKTSSSAAQDAWRARTAPGEVALGLSNLSCSGCRRGLSPEAVDGSKS